MTKDWDIIRAILLRLENSPTPNTAVNANALTEWPEQEVAYNMRLLKEAGLIQANIMESNDGSGRIGAALARRLTNSGHELLDTIRQETVWTKVKDTFSSKGLDMTFDLVVTVGKRIMEAMLS